MRITYPRTKTISLFMAALLPLAMVACVTTPQPKKVEPAQEYSQLMSKAEAQAEFGNYDSALGTFAMAAQVDSTRKEPWIRSAQLYFDNGSYGRAIVAAEEALQRDSKDVVAESVLTISGLRVAGESLQRLQKSGAISSESARKEAQQLAALMRVAMGGAALAPDRKTKPAASVSRPKKATVAPVPASTPAPAPAAASPSSEPSSNPFDKLRGN